MSNSVPGKPLTTTKLPEAVPERLSIAHLLLWTALSAAVLSTARLKAEGMHDAVTTYLRINALIESPLFGLGLAAWLLCWWRLICHVLRRGPRISMQPGHWLLLLMGAYGLAEIAMSRIPLDRMALYVYAQLGCGLLALLTNCVATIVTPQPWRSIFWIGAVRSIWQLGLFLLQASQLIYLGNNDSVQLIDRLFAWGLVGAIAIAAIIDWRRRTCRDFFHWAGVASLIFYITYSFAQPYFLEWLVLSSAAEA